VMKEETFGPVIAVMAVEDQEEAIRYANESHYGLNASVWSRDLSLARSVAMRLRTGGVCINDVVLNYGIVDAPFSGVKWTGPKAWHERSPQLHRGASDHGRPAWASDRDELVPLFRWPTAPFKKRLGALRRSLDAAERRAKTLTGSGPHGP
jgi:hypothetical protein